MSTDVNVYVYSTSNLLFLAGSALQLKLIPKHGDESRVTVGIFGCRVHADNVGFDVFGLRMSLNGSLSYHCTVELLN